MREGLGEDAVFFDMPPGESGDAVNIGATSFVHISAKTKNPDLAAAYLDWITGSDAANELVAPSRSRRRRTQPSRWATARPAGQGRLDQLVEGGGLTLFHDWSSPTMLQTMGQSFQEMLAGRISPGT